MDIGEIEHVFSYDCPRFIKTYIHRAGRTARAGKEGRATTILCGRQEEAVFEKMMKEAGKEMPNEESANIEELNMEAYEEAKNTARELLKVEGKQNNYVSNNRVHRNKHKI